MSERNLSGIQEQNSMGDPKREDMNPVAKSAGDLVGAFNAKYLTAIDALATGMSSESVVREQLKPVFRAMDEQRITVTTQMAVKREMVKEALGPNAKPEKINATLRAIEGLEDLQTIPAV